MEIIYRSSDNKEFQFEEDCLQHEQDQQLEMLKNEIVGLDWDENFVDIAKVGIADFFDTIAVVAIKTVHAAKFLDDYEDYVDITFGKPGIWFWDSNEDCFVPLEEKRKEFKEKIRMLDSFKDLLEN